MGVLSDKIFKNLRTVYAILKGVREGKLKAEIYAEIRSSNVYKVFDLLEKAGYIKCFEDRKGRTRYKKCFLTDSGGKLLDLIEKIIEIDQAPG